MQQLTREERLEAWRQQKQKPKPALGELTANELNARKNTATASSSSSSSSASVPALKKPISAKRQLEDAKDNVSPSQKSKGTHDVSVDCTDLPLVAAADVDDRTDDGSVEISREKVLEHPICIALVETLGDAEDERDAFEKEVKVLNSQVASLKSHVTELELISFVVNQSSVTEKELKDARDEIVRLQSEKLAANKLIHELRTEKEAMITKQTQQHQQFSDERKRLIEKVMTLTNQVREYQTKLQGTDDWEQKFETELANMKETYQAALEEAAARIAELQKQK